MPQETVQSVLLIIGMRDNACRERVVAALSAVDGVEDVAVNLPRAQAVVEHRRTCVWAVLALAVTDAGFGVARSLGQQAQRG